MPVQSLVPVAHQACFDQNVAVQAAVSDGSERLHRAASGPPVRVGRAPHLTASCSALKRHREPLLADGQQGQGTTNKPLSEHVTPLSILRLWLDITGVFSTGSRRCNHPSFLQNCFFPPAVLLLLLLVPPSSSSQKLFFPRPSSHHILFIFKMLALRAFSAPVPRQCLRVAPRAAASWSVSVGFTRPRLIGVARR